MSYQALYRKYRPSTLNDVIGQDVVIQILKNALLNNKVCHAYMFSGPRGIGKTSIAKLLAKAVNCTNLEDGDACGKCENCVSINEGSCPDIIEIDAASNNGVDEIREIKNKVNLVPNQLKYKVYIIDEVHMLSIGAFNALLKTLEEPPEHVIFILATTDLHKVPTTIISRCQCFEFHRISNVNIVSRLKYICEAENIRIEDNVLEMIANLSDGGLRDAVGMLDKLNAYSNSSITIDDFEKVNGIVSKDQKIQFLNYIQASDISNTINFLDSIYDNGKDFVLFVQDLLYLCKDLIINYYINNDSQYDSNFLISFSILLNDLLKEIKFSSDIKTIVEIYFLNYMNKNANIQNNEKIEAKSDISIPKSSENTKNTEKIDINDNNSHLESKTISREIISDDNLVQNGKINDMIVNNCFARADKNEKRMFESKWNSLNDYALDSEYGAAACFISDGKIRAVGLGEVILSFNYESMINRGFSMILKIQKLLEKIYQKHYDVALLTDDEWNQEKEKYIQNMNNHVPYQYVTIDRDSDKDTLPVQNSNSGDIKSQAIELFGEDMVSIN
ncbi:DNA polymerase III subunit gamma/tau [bacterium]|nr:DNA polymerase III subunit gamma/tau [bacterium]